MGSSSVASAALAAVAAFTFVIALPPLVGLGAAIVVSLTLGLLLGLWIRG